MSNVAVISRREASILKVLMELLKSFFDAMGTRIKVMSPSAINNNGQLVPRNALPIDSRSLKEVGLRVSLPPWEARKEM